MTTQSKVSRAVQLALLVAVTGGASATAIPALGAQASASTQAGAQKPKTLQAVVVTGSHIRRAELETDNPVVSVSAAQIQATGKLTIGDVIQDLPAVTGGLANPGSDFSGVAGATEVGLRGLGASRTLLLVDGQRVIKKDLNAIPTIAVERIEVLTSGAAAIYGSDAIGGVINVILKRNYSGAQFSANYGISDHNDGERKGGSFLFGGAFDNGRGNFTAGLSYSDFAAVHGRSRDFSKNILNLSTTESGKVTANLTGSTVAPRGYVVVPPTLAAKFGCSSGQPLSLNVDAWTSANSPTARGDFHCYDPTKDSFNYLADQTLQVPVERTNSFVTGTFHLTDKVDFYATLIHSTTKSKFLFGAAFLSSAALSGTAISKDSYYNPFGVDFSPNGASYSVRLTQLGERNNTYDYSDDNSQVGFKGRWGLFGHTWDWNIGLDYGHYHSTHTYIGYVDERLLAQGLQASFMNAQGTVQCGTPSAPIDLSQCVPWDPFNTQSNATKAFLATVPAESAVVNTWSLQKTYHADANGGVFNLPAGIVQLAVGASYRKEYSNNAVPQVALLNPTTGSCPLASECTAPLHGGFNVKDAYAELFIPILQNQPFAHGLNVTLGDRYSRYNTFGSTSNWKIGVEWRPISDLLLRGTVSKVFRTPSIANLFGAPAGTAPFLGSDPCDHITVANPACVGVPLDGSFVNRNVANSTEFGATIEGAATSGFPLGPELGKSFDFGVVYSPSFIPRFSVTADAWRIYLNGTITTVGPQNVIDFCFNGMAEYCPLINRVKGGVNAGQIQNLILPVANLGRLDVKGVDLNARYELPTSEYGRFTFNVSTSYLDQFKIQTAPGESSNTVFNAAGRMSSALGGISSACPAAVFFTCFYPRWRGQTAVSWSLGPWDVDWRTRYIGRFRMDGSPQGRHLTGIDVYGATIYNDVSVAYNISPLRTLLSVGVNNAFDKQPPLLFNGRAANANTDPQDFDTLGRYYWARVTVSF